jgi:hypothetical protein
LWKDRGLIWIAWPVTAHCQIQDDEEWMLEHPFSADILRPARTKEVAIHIPADLARFPLDREDVKIVCEPAFRQDVI